MTQSKEPFIQLCLQHQVLRFGEFTLKSGRISPYFFNAGLFHSGEALQKLGGFYADTIHQTGIEFDVLFGPAYKGIPLATATAIALTERYQRDTALAFNRKEIKNHGEGGQLMGAPLRGRVLIIDDVITAGTAFRQSYELITHAGAKVCGMVIAMDRQERGQGDQSALDEIRDRYDIPVISIIQLNDILQYLKHTHDHEHLASMEHYRSQYGV